MSNYPRLDADGLLYYSQQIKEKIDDSIEAAQPGDMQGATASSNGKHGLVPQPNSGQQGMFLRGDGVWAAPEGTPNTIESISVNGTAVTPDAQKNVDIDVPTKISDLTNDSNFAVDANYVHTDNNYTNDEKTKLAGIATGAQVNVKADWAETDASSDAYIQNKPSIPANTSDLTNDSNFVSDANYVHTDSNFTADEKTKLAGIATGAQVNVKANWDETDSTSDAFIQNKPSIPSKVSDLTNDSNFQTDTEVAAAISTAISGITQFDYSVVSELPATGVKGTIYLVPNSGSGDNVYDEYIWIVVSGTGKFEFIGTTQMDLSGYVQATEMTTIPNTTIDSIVAQAFGE